MLHGLAAPISILLAAAASSPASGDLPPRPNIVLIQMDDMGVGDLAINGNRWARTPNIDQLARESVRFHNYYVHSVCAPTRASLLTGRHFLRTGVSGVHGGRDFMHLGETTIAEMLHDAGYATGMYGKWHLGKTDGYFPWDRGFDDAWMAELYRYRNARGWRNGERVETTEWSESHSTDMAIEFLRENRDGPFFLYMPYMTPHEPYDAPDEYVDRYKNMGLKDPAASLYAVNEFADYNIGRLLDELNALELNDRTIVLFMSDNGPIDYCSRTGSFDEEQWAQRNPLPYRGKKGQNWENGVISPFYIRWTGTLSPGERFQVTSIHDIAPTLLALASAAPPEAHAGFDGRDMQTLLMNDSAPWPDEPIYISQWNPEIPGQDNPLDPWTHHVALSPEVRERITFEDQRLGVRTNRYKLLWGQYGGLSIDNIEFRDLWSDRWERENVYPAHTEKAEAMLARLRAWHDDILDEPHSYRPPVFQVGWKGARHSTVLAYGPSKVEGDLWNNGFALGNWKSTGDAAQYDVLVHEGGEWTLTLAGSGDGADEATYELEIAGERTPVAVGEASAAVPLSPGRHRLTLRLTSESAPELLIEKMELQRVD